MRLSTRKSGFTLVELLIVISIMGMLTAVVAASTTQARAKARDTRRISDMKEIQLGLALYFDVNKTYPASLDTLLIGKYIPGIPTDPLGGTAYEYLVTSNRYCIGVKLEGTVPSDSASCTSASSGSTANYKAQPTN